MSNNGAGRLSAWQGTKRCWIEASADQIDPRTSRRASHVALLRNIVVKILYISMTILKMSLVSDVSNRIYRGS
jgi:hypothetical protein